MARRKKDEGIDFKKLMSDPIGKWLIAPVLIAILVYFGIAVFATLAQVAERVPTWFMGGAGVTGAGIYYAVHLRKLFGGEGARVAVMGKSDGVGIQDVSDRGVAPIIKGDNNTVTVIHSTASKPRTKKLRKSDGSIKASGSAKAKKGIKVQGSIDMREEAESARDDKR